MQSVGTTLQAMRIRRGRTVEELASRTRIPKRVIECVERDDFGSLPAPVYIKGFLRALCRELDYEATDVVQLFEAAIHAQDRQAAAADAPMLMLHSSEPPASVARSLPAQGLKMAHAVLLFVAALTFLAAILTAAFRDGDSATTRPGAAIRGADAGMSAASTDSRR